MREPPYSGIWRQLEQGLVVPFLGAGASRSARIRSKQDYGVEGDSLPSGGQLAEKLAQDSELPSKEKSDREDLAKVPSYYISQLGRPALRQYLGKLFGVNYQPSLVHRMLAEAPTPMLIVTTNYDNNL